MSSVGPWSSLAEQVAAIQRREISARDLADTYRWRLATHDNHLASHVAVNPTLLRQAEALDAALDRGEDPGPLAGACISIKDNCTTEGMPTRAGTAVDALQFSEEDAHVVKQLRRAGALILGKTRMHEFAWGNVTPPTRNPWQEECVPGGSSGGSAAAVAAGLCGAAIGTDTGGSVRIPATLCGTVGLKPTFGLLGRSGIVPHSWSLDHPGPLTRTVDDAAIMLTAMVGPDSGDPSSVTDDSSDYLAACNWGIQGKTVGVIRNHFSERLAEDVEERFQADLKFLRDQGVTIREVEVPSLKYGLGAIFAIELASASAYHDYAIQRGLTEGFTDDVRALVDIGRLVSSVDYLHAEQARSLIAREMAEIFTEVDAIVSPTSPITAWRSGYWEIDVQGRMESVLAASWRFTYPFNLTGLPAISVPAGFDRAGLPIGLQFAGRPFAEPEILALASVYEKEQDWRNCHPEAYA